MHEEGQCSNHDHVLLIVHGPPDLGTGQVADSLFSDDGSFNEQFEFVLCFAFSSVVKSEPLQEGPAAHPPTAPTTASVSKAASDASAANMDPPSREAAPPSVTEKIGGVQQPKLRHGYC